jgi:Lon protease-like protein
MPSAVSDLLPLFPLPTVVLFPGVFLPLHIFEPRYRQMVADALGADRLIGMVLLREGWQHDYEGQPPVFALGCTGVITHWEMLPDGRYNIILRGIERFRILEEDHELAYRRASIEPLPERALTAAERQALHTERTRVEALLTASASGGHLDPRLAAAMNDEDVINALGQYLDFVPLEKQALVEQPSILDRARALVELLEMRALTARTPGASPLSH